MPVSEFCLIIVKLASQDDANSRPRMNHCRGDITKEPPIDGYSPPCDNTLSSHSDLSSSCSKNVHFLASHSGLIQAYVVRKFIAHIVYAGSVLIIN